MTKKYKSLPLWAQELAEWISLGTKFLVIGGLLVAVFFAVHRIVNTYDDVGKLKIQVEQVEKKVDSVARDVSIIKNAIDPNSSPPAVALKR